MWIAQVGHLREVGGQSWIVFGPRNCWSLQSITKAFNSVKYGNFVPPVRKLHNLYCHSVKYHGKLTNSVLPPHNMTPILRTSGQIFMISSVLNRAAATDAPAEASMTSFILSATIFIPLSISSLLIVNTDSSINSHNIGKVS